MVKRRSLDDALSPAEQAFLDQGTHKPEPSTESPLKPQPEETPMARPTPLKEAFLQEAAPPVQRQKVSHAAKATAGTGAINARIDPVITTALLRASFERRLEGRTPSTQREIIAEALSDWLKKNGYPM